VTDFDRLIATSISVKDMDGDVYIVLGFKNGDNRFACLAPEIARTLGEALLGSSSLANKAGKNAEQNKISNEDRKSMINRITIMMDSMEKRGESKQMICSEIVDRILSDSQ